MLRYRDCCREIWNTYCGFGVKPNDDWNRRDLFCDMSVGLFRLLVLSPLTSNQKICKTPGYFEHPDCIKQIRVMPKKAVTGIYVSREIGKASYWDFPVKRDTLDACDFCFIDFFDFDVQGKLEYAFYRVRIAGNSVCQEVIGHDALIKVDACDSVWIEIQGDKTNE